jgi:nucleoside 2-deoxyribosyltransferase
MNRRKVVVAMPYGGSGAERRKAILNFSRLKYIVENKCQVVPPVPSTTGTRVDYDVVLARTAMDRIPERALERIRSADILIALLSEQNQAVAYELGYRRARERTVILMVDSKDDVRPVYEKSVAYQDWRQDDVLKEIDSIAGSDFPPLAEFEVDIPGALKDVIDARDDGLIQTLQLALQEIEQDFGVWFGPDPVQRLRGILSKGIDRFYPFSVVEVRFSKQGEFEDPPSNVVDFDEDFSRLYGYVSKSAALRDTPLTLDRLLDRLRKFSDTDDWDKFLQEQKTLTDAVIKDYGFARATVPIRINSSHPYDQFRCKSFLPCMAAQVIDGDNLDEPHQMYLLIAYIEVPNGTAHLSTRGEG